MKTRKLSMLQCIERFGLCSTLHYPDDSEWMTEIFVVIAWHILHFQTWSLPVECPEGAKDVHKSMSQTLKWLELSNGIQKWSKCDLVIVVYLGQCAPSLHLWQCQRSQFYQKLKDTACQLKQLAAEWEILLSLRVGLVISCYGQKHQTTYWMTA